MDVHKKNIQNTENEQEISKRENTNEEEDCRMHFLPRDLLEFCWW
jgi:hypothetical protein